MKGIIRRVFGTTRPKEIWGDLLTFDRLLTRPIVHIVYWCGLALFFIAAMAVLGISVGNAIKDPTPMGILLSVPLLVGGWLGILAGLLLWRGLCEFLLAVLSIAEDLRVLRQYQERLEPAIAVPSPPRPAPAPAPEAERFAAEPAPEAMQTPPPPPGHDVLEDPFFNPRFGKRDY